MFLSGLVSFLKQALGAQRHSAGRAEVLIVAVVVQVALLRVLLETDILRLCKVHPFVVPVVVLKQTALPGRGRLVQVVPVPVALVAKVGSLVLAVHLRRLLALLTLRRGLGFHLPKERAVLLLRTNSEDHFEYWLNPFLVVNEVLTRIDLFLHEFTFMLLQLVRLHINSVVVIGSLNAVRLVNFVDFLREAEALANVNLVQVEHVLLLLVSLAYFILQV